MLNNKTNINHNNGGIFIKIDLSILMELLSSHLQLIIDKIIYLLIYLLNN